MLKHIHRMNKKIFMGVFLSPLSLGGTILVLFRVGWEIDSVEDFLEHLLEHMALPFALFYVPFMLIFAVLFHYRMWSAIYDEHVETPPVMAAILMVVPIYNIYWVFSFYPGFAQKYNGIIEQYGLGAEVKPINKSVFGPFPMLVLMGGITGIVSALFIELAMIAGILNLLAYLIFLMIVSQTCNAINTLVDVLEERSISIEEKNLKQQIQKIRKPQEIRRVNTGFHLGFVLLLLVVIIIMFEREFLFFIVPYVVPAILIAIPLVPFHYRMWKAIHEEQVTLKVPPSLAVLLLCIPLLNMFWIFMIYQGFLQYCNDMALQNNPVSQSKSIDGFVFHVFPILGAITEIVILIALRYRSLSSWIRFDSPHFIRYELADFFQFILTWIPWVALFVVMLTAIMYVVIMWRSSDAIKNLTDAAEKKV